MKIRSPFLECFMFAEIFGSGTKLRCSSVLDSEDAVSNTLHRKYCITINIIKKTAQAE